MLCQYSVRARGEMELTVEATGAPRDDETVEMDELPSTEGEKESLGVQDPLELNRRKNFRVWQLLFLVL